MLKHLKGARVLQDCSTGQLFVDTGAGGGCVPMGTQPDWNQNDPTKSDYVKNRPFFTEETVCAEAVFEEEFTPEGNRQVLPEATYEFGKVYTIEVNGVEKKFEFVKWYISAMKMYAVGLNLGTNSQGCGIADLNEAYYFEGNTKYTADKVAGDTITCKLEFAPWGGRVSFPATVKIKDKQVHKLAPKYLPEHDAVIRAYTLDTGDGPSSEATLLSGSYNNILLKMKSNQLVRVLCIYEEDMQSDGEHFYAKRMYEISPEYAADKINNAEMLAFNLDFGFYVLNPDGTLTMP